MGRESCKLAGMAHKARNCSNYDCSEKGLCMPHIAQAAQAEGIPLHRPAQTIPLPERKVEDFKGKVDGGGYKASMDNPKKLPLWLVPSSLILAVAAVLGYGAKKYAANNWRRGMSYSEVYSAIQRHLSAWLEGEDIDEESGLNHIWHAACGLAFLCEYIAFSKLYGVFDDRFKRPPLA